MKEHTNSYTNVIECLQNGIKKEIKKKPKIFLEVYTQNVNN